VPRIPLLNHFVEGHKIIPKTIKAGGCSYIKVFTQIQDQLTRRIIFLDAAPRSRSRIGKCEQQIPIEVESNFHEISGTLKTSNVPQLISNCGIDGNRLSFSNRKPAIESEMGRKRFAAFANHAMVRRFVWSIDLNQVGNVTA
jgi:hypothetical protein